jgi:hypothetical protein
MEGLQTTYVKSPIQSIKCPRCNIEVYKSFEYFYTRDSRTVYKCECKNGHELLYFLTYIGGLLMSHFTYSEPKTFDYKAYLNSIEWKERSEAAKENAGWHCQLCNKEGNGYTLHTHHRTYQNIGNEKPGDLIVLCFECHSKFHDKDN